MKVNLFFHYEELNTYFIYINLSWNSICPLILQNSHITWFLTIRNDCRKVEFLEFPGSPVDRTPCFQCEKLRCHGYLVRELRSCKLWSAAPTPKKTKKQKKKQKKPGSPRYIFTIFTIILSFFLIKKNFKSSIIPLIFTFITYYFAKKKRPYIF